MGDMRSTRRSEVSLKTSAQQLTDHNVGAELTTGWKSLAQSKAALRHIENRIVATPGTGVLLDSVMDPPKKKSSRTLRRRDGQQADDNGGSSKHRGRSQQSPEKSSSRSPLRNTTHDSNVRRNNNVEFREPLASYREATPPSSQLEAYSLQSLPASLNPSSVPPSGPLLSQLVYQRDTRDTQTDGDLDSTHSSALENTEVRYLNDRSALDTLRTIVNQSNLTCVRTPAREGAEEESTSKAQLDMDSQESSPGVAPTPTSIRRGESTPSTSPGSASQRLENLRRHQPDDKLEKLKERIRRQRQHLDEAAEREKLLGYLEPPIMAAVESSNAGTSNMPTAKIRKVAAAPPAPIYKGFNSTETKIQTPDGKVWKEQEFHNLSREIYRDLSRQFAESSRYKHQQQREQRADRSKERKPPKPVRKVHRAAPASDLNAKPVISPASWREGQKLVKMVLGPDPKLHKEEDRPHPTGRPSRTASRHRSSSDPRSESHRQSVPKVGTERSHSGFQGQTKSHSIATFTPSSARQDKDQVGTSKDLLSADIQGILNDLQLECKAADSEDIGHQRGRVGSVGRKGRGGSGSRTRTPVSVWEAAGATGSSSRGCRSASPTTHRPETASKADATHKKRHYDADTVRQYIARQQEERKRRQAEDKKTLREEAEKRNQRLQELYRKQKEVAKMVTLPREGPVAPVQKRLQETYNKLMLEGSQQGDTPMHTQLAAPSSQMRPIYQPSGESDKENKRLEAPQSPSSSDRSLNDQLPLPLSSNDLDGGVASWLHPDHQSRAVQPTAGLSNSVPAPFGDHILSRLLRLETAVATSDIRHTQQLTTAPSNRSHFKTSRIEALKATAASLSNRIESEARKLVGEGINYGAATTDMDTILTSGRSQANLDDGCWTEMAASENNDMAFRIQRIFASTGHGSYNGTTLPGVGNLYTLNGQKEDSGTRLDLINPQTTTYETEPILSSYTQERRKVVNDFEKVERMDKMAQRRDHGKKEDHTENHDSSAGSISEGPILSEGSFSEDGASPPHPFINVGSVGRAADRLGLVGYGAGQRTDDRLSEFQKEAARCSALNSPLALQDNNKAAWEELNKGSPLSVINIFTKNLKVSDRNSERNSLSAHSLHSGNGPADAAVYEDDFVSSHSSRASSQLRRASNSPSVNSHFEELMRRSPYEKSTGGIISQHSSFHSSIQSPHLSSGSASGSSPLSKHSASKQTSDQSDATLVEEQRSSCSPLSEALSSDSRKKGSDKNFAHSQAKSVHSSDTLEKMPGQFQQSLELDSKKTRGARAKQVSPSGSPDPCSPPRANNMNTAHSGRAETRTTGELQYSPAVLQKRMAAELEYLESIEESVRQLDNMEKLMSVSMAQQESASLAQMLKAKQQQHERDLYELKIKAEREALETQLQLEENRQRVARAHIELQESLAANQKEALEGLQEATTKMMSQQAEAAQYTVDTARHIKEMTELARSQIGGALGVPPIPSMLDQQEEQQDSCRKQRQDQAESDSLCSEMSSRRSRPEELPSSLNSHSDSLSFRRPNICVTDSSSHNSPSRVPSDQRERVKKDAKGGVDTRTGREAGSSSIEEEIPSAANDSICSIPSVVDEKGDSTSVATEYSLKFDESMTEDEIEERSFRSLLPSEAHRRGTMEKKPRHHEESEDDAASHNTTQVSGAHNILKDANMAFSGGQDSFSQFTMDMVRQYMKDEEVRLQHQSSLLRLRQKALKEKTRAELAWLEHQKKRLRDKGEDDKMPPIRKKQRGLLLKLQQEQAEIKRLQEANKAAMKERQLLLKQQEEIERLRNSTLRLKERLKNAGGEAPPETLVSETLVSAPASLNMRHGDDNRSPSPSLSISGSETSSIMQKLKKMHSHMDEKFLTKREQQLMQRRHHAEELLQWKQRLDQEEAEVRRMEKEALAVWDRQTSQDKDLDVSESRKKEASDMSFNLSHHQSSEPRTDSEKEHVSDDDSSSVRPESSIHTEALGSQQPESPSLVPHVSIPETPLASVQNSPANYTQDFTSASQSPSRESPVYKGSHSPAASPSDGSSKTKMHLPSSRAAKHIQQADSSLATQIEPISDQSDIETRIKALKEELRKRKFMAYQLKKEQKKRHKERLKAQEANLLKQLETYNSIIEKTKAELNKEPDSTPETKSAKDSTLIPEQSGIKLSAHRSECSKSSDRTYVDASLEQNASQRNHSRSTSVPEELSDDDPPTVTPTPIHGSPEHPASEALLQLISNEAKAHIECGDGNIVSDQRTDIHKDLEEELSSRLEDQHSEHLLKVEDSQEDQHSEHLLKLEDSQEERFTSKHSTCSIREEQRYTPSEARETSKVEDVIKPASKSQSPAGDKTSISHPSASPVCVAFSSKTETPIKNPQVSLLTDGYHDDFESSVDSSPREKHRSFQPDSHISVSLNEIKGSRKDSPVRATPCDSQDEEIEEEIAEELSHHSGMSDRSHQSERLLDLDKQTEDSNHDNKSINSTHSPPFSPLHTPKSPIIDEMLDFNIGDRVLVGGVQPGTLRFKGPTSFANGFWAGVELDKSEGSNNGTYDGVVYFLCDECHGIFAPPDKITHLPDKFEMYTDTTEDEDSFDDLSGKGGDKGKKDEDKYQTQGNLMSKKEEKSHKNSADKKMTDNSVHMNQASLKAESDLITQPESNLLISNGNSRDIVLDFEDAPNTDFISDMDKIGLGKPNQKITTLEENEDSQHRFTPDLTTIISDDKGEPKDKGLLDRFSDNLFNSFVKDTVQQFAEIKKAKEQKIKAASWMNGDLFGVSAEEDEWVSSVEQKDGLPFFLPAEKEELSSPEMYNRPESPVLGASGQEELAKRLAELELSRELLDELGDDQDWFDEDFGLSSRREQQRLKQKQEEEEARLGGGGLRRPGSSAVPAMGGLSSSPGGEQQAKTPPRPELPLLLPPKLPEQPAMVVPHSAIEVEKMVHAATKEIWESYGLAMDGAPSLPQLPNHKPSQEYLGKEASDQDQEALSIRSYRKAVFDLTWEILQEIFAEDPNADQPQWVKPQRVKSSFFHKIKSSGELAKIQEFITAEVLKLYGLAKDQSQKTDWQKMLKFGRKKRDRVDHILVQELHEEEAQWVNYDEDELFVKMQLADSIFDALLKDTVNALTLICDNRAKRQESIS